MNAPRGMAVDPDTGALYAVDWWNQRIEKFEADGAYQLQWGHRGTRQEPGSINFAWDAAVDPASGNVFVANRESHEIEVFAPNGDYVTRWGTRGSTDGKFTFPQGVAFDPTDGSLLVADSGNDRIQRFDILPSGLRGVGGDLRRARHRPGRVRRADRHRRRVRRHDLGGRHRQQPDPTAQPRRGLDRVHARLPGTPPRSSRRGACRSDPTGASGWPTPAETAS